MKTLQPTLPGSPEITRTTVSDERAAWTDLGPLADKPAWLERDNSLPFAVLSDDAFEICCFVLLLRECPGERIYYYGKTGDKGRDIVRRHADGTVEFIQCKRYTRNVGVEDVREEFAKLCVNTFENRLPEKPDRVTFFVAPDLTSGAQDLLSSRQEWRLVAPKALEDHLGRAPSADLLAFANDWWPTPDRVAGAALSVRVQAHPTLLEQFFAVKKVIEGSAAELKDYFRAEIQTLKTGLASAIPSAGAATGGPAAPLTKAQEIVGRGRDRIWEERARRSLDAHGLKLWEDIRTEIRGLNNTKAVDAGKQLKDWLLADGAHASAVTRGRVCILLADLAVIESGISSLQEHVDVSEARAFQGRAADELGDAPVLEDASRLVYLDARLTWLEGRPADALAVLDGVDDPNCTSLKLSILITEGRDDEAAEVARSLPPDDRWCDRTVLAYARRDLGDDAERVLAWAQERPEPVVYHRCLIAWAQGTLQRLFRDRDGRSLFLAPLPPEDEGALRELQADLDPLAAAAVSRGLPAGGTETEALELAFVIARLLGRREQWEWYGALLAKAKPVSPEYARAVCRGELVGTPDLPTRLRADYPRSFTAAHMAAVVEALDGTDFAAVAASAEALIPLATADEQRGQIAELVLERAFAEDGTDALDRARATAGRLLGGEHPLVRLAGCEAARRADRPEEADALLEACRDEANPVWLQIAAAHAHRRGDARGAAGHLLKAARLLGRRETYWQVFSLASTAGDADVMREVMQTLARLTPDDPAVHRNLAAIDFRAGRYRDAAAGLRRADKLTPGTAELGLYLGQALALAGRGDEAVTVLDRVCAAHPAAFPPHHLRAVVLDSLGKPGPAFDGLHAVRERFWGDMAFVQVYHTLALKVNREHEAHIAFLRVHELQAGDPNGPLRPGTLDELRELMRRERDRHDHLNRQLLAGRLPWPVVGRSLRREAYLDWAIRTQETFVPDAPVARAEYAVYATNGLCVRSDGDESRSLEPVTASPAGRPVVADLSALLTLHRLGLLERALAYFGRVVLPAGYAARFLEERRSLQPHQASQVEARRAILAAVDQGRLRSLPAVSAPGGTPAPVLDEHHPDEETADFHLIDAVDWLRRTGRITEDAAASARAVCHRPALARESADFPAAATRQLRVTVVTLTTVHGLGLLDRFLATMRLCLEQDEVEELRRDLLGVERRGELTCWTRELQELLTADERVETAEPTLPPGTGDEDDSDRELDPALDALLLAEQRKLPLLADDRCLQALLLNARHGEPGAAFGTDALLAALAAGGRTTGPERAEAWLQLARWRYRFLVPPPEVLLELAARHPSFPPGEELREVCRYVHDCCLDPGLFCGMEPVEPPVSVGWRYFQGVVQAIGHFLIRAWHDPRFDQTALTALTRWAAGEFVPPPPRQLPYAGYAVACDSVPRVVLVAALAEAALFGDARRSNTALVAIADAFGVSADEYEDTVALLVERDLSLPDVPDAEALDTAVRRRTAFAALRHRQGIGIRVATALADLGILDPVDDPVGESDVPAIGDPAHPRRIAMPAGPWVFLRGTIDGEPNAARYVPDLLFHPKSSVRRAALSHLTDPTATEWTTSRTRDVLASAAADIGSEDARRTRLAARSASSALERDFLLALARFRQARSSRLDDENAEAIKCLLEPNWASLASVPAAWYHPPTHEWDDFLRATVAEPTIGGALDRYYERYGHLPLAAPFAAEAVVRAWTNTHGSEGVWGAVRVWADDACRPLAQYHTGRVFLASPALVPDADRAEAWAVVTGVLNGFEDDPTQPPSLRGQAWSLLGTLARHYLQVLEVGSHEESATSLAALAWWGAERVTRVFVRSAINEYGPERAAGILRRTLLKGLLPLTRRSAVGWVLGRPTRVPSALSHGTLQFNTVWRPSLLDAGPGPDLTVPSEQAEEIVSVLAVAFVTGFPARLAGAPSPTLVVDAALAPLANRWAAVLPDADGPQHPPEILSEGSTRDDPDDPAPAEEPENVAHLRTICVWEADARQLPLRRLRSAIGLGGVTPQQLRWLLDDRQWWDDVFEQLSRDELDGLCVSLFELIRAGGEEWQLTLPHLFRAQALRDQVGAEKRAVAAGAVVQAAIITGHRGALVLLVREATSPDLLSCFADWRRRLTDILRVVPATIQAMVRATLAVLPPDG